MTTAAATAAFAADPAVATRRRFVPADLDPADWDQLQPLYDALLGRELDSPDALEQWLADYSELSAVVSEAGSRRNITFACHTDDEEAEAAFLHFVENIAPKVAPLADKLHRKYLESPALAALDPGRYDILTREWKQDVELFREQNVAIKTEVTKLTKRYDQLMGAMEVEFKGETLTLQQLGRYQEDTDRDTREQAWRLAADRRLRDRDAIEGVYDAQVKLRQQIAENAGFENFRDYQWKAFGRFDYTPDDVYAFHDAIERVIVPRIAEVDRQRKQALGLDTLRPWDTAVDIKGRPPLQPFSKSDVQDLVTRTKAIFQKVEPSLAEDFARLRLGRNLDLDSRRGKRGGGFQASLSESKEPFIFMNAAGLQRDVETMLHEGGHAFHFVWASANEPLLFLQHAPIEFCEVASMSMELIAAPFLETFYDHPETGKVDADRARRVHLLGVLRVLPWIATISAFQHWVYLHPGHTREQRRDAWRQTFDRFSGGAVDWAGLRDAYDYRWHAQLHLFHHPFYYIEYGIAQLGALQLWRNYRDDPRAALEAYRAALTLGGTKTLPELFEAAGIRFDFTAETIEPLIDDLMAELDRLPA